VTAVRIHMQRRSFADLAGTPANHFTLYFYAAVSQLLTTAASRLGSPQALSDRFPFLAGYAQELQRREPDGQSAHAASTWWQQTIAAWEGEVPDFLPLRALRDAGGLDHDAVALAFVVGLPEEDGRFGALFEALHGCDGQLRPTRGLLAECWDNTAGPVAVRHALQHLQSLGVMRVINPDAPRSQWVLEVPHPVLDAMRGDRAANPAPWARYHAPSDLVGDDGLIVPDVVREALERVSTLIGGDDVRTVIVRGPRRNGRRTLLGALARSLGRGTIEIHGFSRPDDERWRQLGLLATALHAVPVVVLDLAPGESIEIPCLTAYRGPLGVVVGRQGGITGPSTDGALTFTLETPDVDLRREHWRRALGARLVDQAGAVSERFRMTGGSIRRVAAMARSHAVLAGRDGVTALDVQQASRALNSQALETLAVRVPVGGDWRDLGAREETVRELIGLELRCRHRERLERTVRGVPGLESNCGVRALFRGPSGTGKTLAARLLASALQMDLYRLDLSSVVNKYIGETEKNLERVLSRAEELNVVLLLDEGDALLTQRTSVQSSTDRYANLETNYLLQRLESFDGILVVTTNAGDRIDAAFERRMDVVVEFHQPEPAERWDIWQMHLPSSHAVEPDFLSDVAARCAISGGQIRNAVLHASLLALDGDRIVTSALIEAAVQREYRKAGAVCPLRRPLAPVGIHR
jgi:hypothetical protein